MIVVAQLKEGWERFVGAGACRVGGVILEGETNRLGAGMVTAAAAVGVKHLAAWLRIWSHWSSHA